MKSLFHPDGPVVRFLGRIAELMALNICFLLCCLPVVTIGASVTALYGSLFARDDQGAVRRFFRQFRGNFRQGTVLGLILGAIGLVLIMDFQLLSQLEGSFALVKYLVYLAALCWAGVSSFAFGLAARFRDGLGRILKNALLLTVSMLPRTVLMVLIDAAPALLLLVAPELFGRSFIVWLLVGFAACAQAKVWVLRDVFAALPEKEETA